MNRKIILSFLVVVFFFNSNCIAHRPETIKVITYNIYNGFNYRKDTAREQKVSQWLKAQKPDVVAFQELCGFTEASLLEFARSWGHQYVALLKEDGHPVGITSNQPIRLKKKLSEGMWHGALHVTSHDIDFFVIHLHPSDHYWRMSESERLINYMKESLSNPDTQVLVLGDFNTHSPYDAFLDKQRPNLLAKYRQMDAERKGKDGFQNLPHNEIEYSVMSRFLGYPLVDLCERTVAGHDRFSFPSPIHFNPPRKREETRLIHQRLDFILVNPSLAARCVSARISNSADADNLSDHYPVIAEFLTGNN